LRFSNFLYKLISFLSIKSEGGLHPKHRLMGYHDFFLNNISENDTVLDIGCGNGSLTYDLAGKARAVTGVEIEKKYLDKAISKHSRQNITYVLGDATTDLGLGKFDVVILSNVLEHIEGRVSLLRKIRGLAPRFLIRVPMQNRDWVSMYKRELGVEGRLDLTHYIEFTEESFRKEISEAGYIVVSLSVQFGEIWAVL